MGFAQLSFLLAALVAGSGGAPSSADKAPEVESGYIKTDDGFKLYYQKTGSGPVIIAPGRLFLFPAFKQLADQYTVISYDMRDRGLSERIEDTSKLSIQHDVLDLEIVRRHFGLQKFTPAGYSYLGLMVMLYAMDHPEHIERVVQIGPVPLKYPGDYPAQYKAHDPVPVPPAEKTAELVKLWKAGYGTSHPKEFCEKDWEINRFRLVGNPANVDNIEYKPCSMPNEYPVALERHFSASFASVQKLDVPVENLSKIKVPVLTIHGTQDRNAPYGSGREWARNLPDARLLTVQNAAHQVFDEYPEVVFPAVRQFMAGKWPDKAEKITGP